MDSFENISFVLIARNEQFGIEKCLTSLASLDLHHCEIICVDSGSTDDTVVVMQRFLGIIPNLRIVTIKGYSNAAVARNAGIRYVTRDYIFFVDGDVEINPSFLTIALQRLKTDAGAVTGSLRELQYTRDFSKVQKEIPDRFYIRNEGKVYASGGCFMATREVVKQTGLFDERLERSQDYDYTLRVSRRFKMLAVPISMGNHHTIGYEDRFRFTMHIKKLQALFFGAVLRRNISNLRGILWLLINRERGLALGGLLWVVGLVVVALYGKIGTVAIGALMAIDLFIGFWKGNDLLYRLYLHYVFPLLTFIGCFYFPDRRRSYNVEVI